MNSKVLCCTVMTTALILSSSSQILGAESGILQSEGSRGRNIGTKVAEAPEFQKGSGVNLSLPKAIEWAISRSPLLAASAHEIRAREAAASQAVVLPNPEIHAEVEEFGGSGEFSGTDAMASRVGVSQEVLLGGKRKKRKRVAMEELELAVIEREAQVAALTSEVRTRFLDVSIAQERLTLAEEDLKLVHNSAEAIEKRVRYGEASPLEEARITVERVAAETAVSAAAGTLKEARQSLASTWGGTPSDFQRVEGDYLVPPSMADENMLLQGLRGNPTYRVFEKESDIASESVGLARAEAVPDIEIGGGIQHFNETGDHAFFLEASIPLPLFDRNRGGIAEAREHLEKRNKVKEATMLELQTSLLTNVNRFKRVDKSYRSLSDTILPASTKIFESIQKGYQVGEQDYLELVDAQRSLLDARRERLDLLAELWHLRLEVDLLAGTSNRTD